MYGPLPWNVHNRPYQIPLSNGLSEASFYSSLKRQSYDDDYSLKNFALNEIKLKKKQRSSVVCPSLVVPKMHQATTNEAMIGVPSRLCSVCGDISTGIHFGGNSCESCKAFFRRSVQCLRFQNYKCSSEERCPVNIVTRKVCQFCRYAKCTAIGMKPKWVLSDQEREEKYGARRKRFRENRATEEDPDIYKYLAKEEKLLVEDIAHALYQSRATYPLNFPSPSVLFGAGGASPDANSAPSPNNEKPPSPSANLLIVPIQRLVLFARMLKDFDLFTEDDKVCLLKGSAIEMMVCSSSTLFNPKTHTFTNYLSRDQRAIMDDQVMPLDPLLTRLWGEEIFNRTRTYLISMCNLNVDEVTSTLLAPVILFSPDRPNIKELDLVKRLQVKYVTVLRKYMNWRYGVEHTDRIYPRLLLQIVNVRTLSLAHGEVIQKLMATSSVNPLVQEVTIKQDLLNRATTERMDSLSISSSPTDPGSMDFDKTPSNETESNGSDDDDPTRKSSRTTYDDDFDFDPDEIDGSDPRSIWRKRRRVSEYPSATSFTTTTTAAPAPATTATAVAATGVTAGPGRLATHYAPAPMHPNITQLPTTTDVSNIDPYQRTNSFLLRPYDHQVPSNLPILQDDVMLMSTTGFPLQSEFESSPLKTDLFAASPQAIQQLQQLYRAQTSTSSDLSPFDFDTRSNPVFNSTLSPASRSLFDESANDLFAQQYSRPSPGTYQQQQNEQQMHLLSLGSHSSPSPAMQSFPDQLTTHASHSTPPASAAILNDEEQQLLDAIHSHPNKRDLVLNLLRQMNQSTSPSTHPGPLTNPTSPEQYAALQQQQQRHPNSSGQDPFSGHFNLEHADRSS